MFWIIGGEELIHAFAKGTTSGRPHRAAAFLSDQFEHQPWEGFHFYDLIFPMFVFVVGVSLVFSLSKLIETRGRAAAVRRVIVRSVILYLFGIIYYGGFSQEISHIRLMGVLQRIALAYLFAGLLFCFLGLRGLVIATVGLLVGYWAVMSFVRAPGMDHVSFAEGKNIANWIDARFLPWRKWDGDHDPEGLLSTFPAIATCLLGVFAGLLLRNGRVAAVVKALALVTAGVACVALGFAWGLQFPVVKKLWTSSFVLVAGGYSAMLLGTFYLVIDVFRLRSWALPFVWIGMNAITLYLCEHFLRFDALAQTLVGGQFGAMVFHRYADLAAALVAVILMLVLARFLYKRQIFLRV